MEASPLPVSKPTTRMLTAVSFSILEASSIIFSSPSPLATPNSMTVTRFFQNILRCQLHAAFRKHIARPQHSSGAFAGTKIAVMIKPGTFAKIPDFSLSSRNYIHELLLHNSASPQAIPFCKLLLGIMSSAYKIFLQYQITFALDKRPSKSPGAQ
jgi:hypothetical protein